MDRDSTRSKVRRKLNKSQVTDILERNVALYREEDNFVHYLVDLAVYLMEYEYDWSESGATPPKCLGHENDTPPPSPAINSRSMMNVLTNEGLLAARRTCPYCGGVVGEQIICPTCRNITK